MYEGISSLCFCYGRLGHKQETCSYQVKPSEKASEVDQSSQVSGCSEAQQKETNFGEWMLMTRKKHTIKSAQSRGANATNQPLIASSKGTKGRNEVRDGNLTPFNPNVTFQFKSGAIGLAMANSREYKESSTQARQVTATKGALVACHRPLNSEQANQPNLTVGNKSLMASPSRSSKDKKNPKPKGSKSLKHPNPKAEPSLQLSLTEITANTKNGSSSPSLLASTHGGLGSLAQK